MGIQGTVSYGLVGLMRPDQMVLGGFHTGAEDRDNLEAHGLPVRIYRVKLPYLDADQLRRKKITPPSSPGVGTAHHHWPPR